MKNSAHPKFGDVDLAQCSELFFNTVPKCVDHEPTYSSYTIANQLQRNYGLAFGFRIDTNTRHSYRELSAKRGMHGRVYDVVYWRFSPGNVYFMAAILCNTTRVQRHGTTNTFWVVTCNEMTSRKSPHVMVRCVEKGGQRKASVARRWSIARRRNGTLASAFGRRCHFL